ncbi:DUF6728 family protein [Ohtaekwangia sp.]|uniref:DUF6728 family protein n=1 Tax=Ohtaekwangia sp. TaxID=2066019 RepID=UPI002FDEEEBC
MEEIKKDTTPQRQPKKSAWKEFFSLGEVGNYFFRKKDPSRPNNINIRMMHGVNRISIIIFLAGVLFLIFKLVIKPRL